MAEVFGLIRAVGILQDGNFRKKNMKHEFQESDWKRFRAIVPELREHYIVERNAELLEIFNDEKLSQTERFWEVKDRQDEIAGILKSCLDGHTRSKMVFFMQVMYRHQMLMDEDMGGFSEGVRERVLVMKGM